MPKGKKIPEPRVIILSNQLSTRNRQDLPKVRKVAERYPYVTHLEGQSLEWLYEQLETFRGTSPELLILNGGDGTIHSALTFLMNQKIFKKPPALALLGGGMTNMNARDLNTGGTPSRSLRNILSCFDKEGCEALYEMRHLLKVTFSDNRPQEFGMFIGGAGFVNSTNFCVTKIYGMGIKGTGAQILTIILMMLSLMVGRTGKGRLAYSPNLKLTFDDKEVAETRYLSFLSTTLHKLAFGSKAPHIPGTFPFFTLRPSVWGIIASFFLARKGTIQNSRNPNIDLRFAKTVKIEGDTQIVIDGETHTPPKGGSMTLSTVGPFNFVSFNKGP